MNRVVEMPFLFYCYTIYPKNVGGKAKPFWEKMSNFVITLIQYGGQEFIWIATTKLFLAINNLHQDGKRFCTSFPSKIKTIISTCSVKRELIQLSLGLMTFKQFRRKPNRTLQQTKCLVLWWWRRKFNITKYIYYIRLDWLDFWNISSIRFVIADKVLYWDT